MTYAIIYDIIYNCYMIIHFDKILVYNIKYNSSILCSKSIRRDTCIAIHIASLSLIARGKKQII